MIILIGPVLILFLYIGINVFLVARNSATFPEYWKEQARQPVPAHAIRMVALGDSIMLAVGAAHPEDGIAGRIASYLRTKTGLPVHVINVSAGGALIKDILEEQLPQVNLSQADLIILASATEMEKRVPLESFESDLRRLVDSLPPEKTVLSDLPLEPGRGAYQAVFQRIVDERGIQRADFAEVFQGEGRRLDIFSWLFPHLNSKGYNYWFKAFQPKVDMLFGVH